MRNDRREDRVNKFSEVRQARMILFLSKSCQFCRQLVEQYDSNLDSLGVVKLYVEEDRSLFLQEYLRLKEWFRENNPELANYPYVTPVLLVRDESFNLVGVYVGYMNIKNFLDQLISTQQNNE